LGKILLGSKVFSCQGMGYKGIFLQRQCWLTLTGSIDPYCLAIATSSATEESEEGKAGQFDKRGAAGCIYDECGCNHVLANKNCLQTTPEAL
jgi:hypothetical protein